MNHYARLPQRSDNTCEWMENILKGTRLYLAASLIKAKKKLLCTSGFLALSHMMASTSCVREGPPDSLYFTELFVYTARAIRGAMRWPAAAHEFVVSIFGSSGGFSFKGPSALTLYLVIITDFTRFAGC